MDDNDPTAQLRGAVYRGDAAAIVALLQRTELAEWLQLGGDGLVVALTRHAEGAATAAGQWAGRLRDRGWDGDLELAEQLDARLGTGPTPLLRPLPVDLEELAALLEGDPLSGGGRVDLRTGEVWPLPAIEYAVEIGEEDEDASEAPWWLPVHCEGSRDGYRDMQAFIATVADDEHADRLATAIRGRGAFRRFKDVLGGWPGELERWFAFAEERRRGRTRAWLAGEGYYVAPPAGRARTDPSGSAARSAQPPGRCRHTDPHSGRRTGRRTG